jgi:hypothetical protein
MHNKSILGILTVIILRFLQKEKVKYSHVALAISETDVLEASWKGVIQQPFEKSISHASRVKIFRRRGLYDSHRERLRAKAVSQIGKHYNIWRLILQIPDNIFCTNWFTKNLSFTVDLNTCSTFVAWVYYEALNIKFNDVHWISTEPDDIDDESAHSHLWELL